MKVKNILLPFLISCIISLEIFAGTTGKIVGVVKDKNNGENLIGVNVLIEGTYLGATTDLEGAYLILNVPPGKYTLSYQYIGYREVQMSGINVSVDFTTRVNIELEEALIELEETIIVVADREIIRKDLTSSQSEVTSEDIATLPAEQFEDVLQLQSGVSRDQDGGFHIRGGRSSEVAYWVDGVSVTDVFDGSNGVEIENDAVQSLQVISGTFNAEYGQAMSGIINIVTKDGGNTYKGNVTAYAGDYISNDDEIFQNIDDISITDIYDYKFSLSGPVPFTDKKANFFINFRNNYNDGYLYGKRDVNTVGTTGDGEFVPLNLNKWLSTQTKITFHLTELMKLRLGFNYESREFREYDQFYKFNPDGEFDKFQFGYNGSVTLDHTLSNTTFYTLKVARFEKEFEQYVYKNPEDLRYVNSDDEQFVTQDFQFSIGGQKNQHFKRNTQTNILKFDLTSQISDQNLIKAGIEARLYKLDLLDFNILDGSKFTSDTAFFPIRAPKDNINYDEYSFKPLDFSFYIQDKMEYEDFIFNIGIRFDYFNSKGNVLVDPKDPNIYSPLLEANDSLLFTELEKKWYKDPLGKIQISPRLGMAFPISATGVIHASYGHFAQIPEFRLLYDNPGFKIERGQDNLVGNADLKPQKTIMYEIGLQQELSPTIGVDLTGFYRDIRDWVGTSILKDTYRDDHQYSQYENRDYANVRGVTISINKHYSNNFSGNLSYTMQVAEGSATNPDDAFNDIKDNKEPQRSIIPLEYDRTHILNGNVYFTLGTFGISLLGRYESGLPYTPEYGTGTTRGANLQAGFSSLQENSERRPTLLTFDLQLYKEFEFDIAGRVTKINIFAKLFNIFDSRNEQRVWNDTGRATYTLESSGANADPGYIIRPDYYTEPRRLQAGISFNF